MSCVPYLAKMKRKGVENKTELNKHAATPNLAILYHIQLSQAKAKPGFPYHCVIIFHTPHTRVWGPFVSMLYWTPSKCCPILSAFAFHIRYPPSTTPALLLGCFLHLYSANTIGLHDQQHRGTSCKSTGRSPLLGISHQEWLNVWDSFEQTRFGSGGLRHDIKRHIAARAQEEAVWVK